MLNVQQPQILSLWGSSEQSDDEIIEIIKSNLRKDGRRDQTTTFPIKIKNKRFGYDCEKKKVKRKDDNTFLSHILIWIWNCWRMCNGTIEHQATKYRANKSFAIGIIIIMTHFVDIVYAKMKLNYRAVSVPKTKKKK